MRRSDNMVVSYRHDALKIKDNSNYEDICNGFLLKRYSHALTTNMDVNAILWHFVRKWSMHTGRNI